MRITKKMLVISGVSALVLLLVFFLFGLNLTMKGYGWGSDNIEEARELRVFVCSYQPSQSTLQMFGDVVVDIEEVWIERHWTYGLIRGSINRNVGRDRYDLNVRCGARGVWNMVGEADRIELICTPATKGVISQYFADSRRFHTSIIGSPPDSLRLAFVRRRFTEDSMFADTGAVIIARRVGSIER